MVAQRSNAESRNIVDAQHHLFSLSYVYVLPSPPLLLSLPSSLSLSSSPLTLYAMCSRNTVTVVDNVILWLLRMAHWDSDHTAGNPIVRKRLPEFMSKEHVLERRRQTRITVFVPGDRLVIVHMSIDKLVDSIVEVFAFMNMEARAWGK